MNIPKLRFKEFNDDYEMKEVADITYNVSSGKISKQLEDGKYTTSPVKSSLGYHIILRTNTKEKAKLDDVKNTIIEKLAEELISNDNTTSVNALQALRKEYGMEINDSELNKQYSNFIQNSLAAAIEANSSQNEE